MPAKLKYEVVATTGKYMDKDGNEKNSYAKIGVVLEGDKGLNLKLESIPVGWNGWAFFSEPKEREQKSEPKKAKAGDPPF